MERDRPAQEGARIYNLFPLMAGPMSLWPAHMRRAREMGFNWVFVNSFHYPGFSGSLYSVKDYYQIRPLLVTPGLPENPMQQLRQVVREGRGMGLHMMMDLIINHTAVDSPLVTEHPAWYLKNDDGAVVNPAAWEGDKQVAVWGDLAEVDNANSPDRESLWKYWEDLALFYRDAGFEGFRCDAAYQVTDRLWKRLIPRVKEAHPGTLFFAETLGCEIKDVVKLAKAGFDYIFNSSKYWDYEEEWCLSQYRESARWASSVSFAESHDTARLFEELDGDVTAVKQRYLFSALFSTGVMMPIGFEFGFRKRLHVVETRPEDWEGEAADLRPFIQEVNRLKKSHPVFNQDGPIQVVDLGNPRVLCLLKKTFAEDACAWIVLNKDRGSAQAFQAIFPEGVFPGASPIREVTPGSPPSEPRGDMRGDLPPSGFRVFHAGPRGPA